MTKLYLEDLGEDMQVSYEGTYDDLVELIGSAIASNQDLQSFVLAAVGSYIGDEDLATECLRVFKKIQDEKRAN